ncbi:MAG: YlmC/YmxH family sporulation protein [Clostridia bacterium]|nr:YlmC/YmxH family sporulation protein [Clostridia bacterium]
MVNYCDLKRKEIINLCDGARLGNICDMEIDSCTGQINTIVVPGPPKLFGMLKSDEEIVIPYNKIKKIGDDVILIDIIL